MSIMCVDLTEVILLIILTYNGISKGERTHSVTLFRPKAASMLT